jgi:curli biogenesis system outer membrane secretion channel CsgG
MYYKFKARKPDFRICKRYCIGLESFDRGSSVTVFSLLKISMPVLVSMFLSACAVNQTSRVIQAPTTAAAAGPAYSGKKFGLVVGKFENRSQYMRGMFSDGTDHVGSQAKTNLIAHLQHSGRFSVMDRANLKELQQEATLTKFLQAIKGAKFVVARDITEFGRMETGDQQLFGILDKGKLQVAYAKVNLNIVNVQTSEVVYSTIGAGEFALSERQVVGFGTSASYDSALTGKVLDLAIRETVEKLVTGIDSSKWKPE